MAMKNAGVISAMLLALLLAAAPAKADECEQIAGEVAAQYEAEVLAVRFEEGTCVVKLRIPGADGKPPRVETVTVPG